LYRELYRELREWLGLPSRVAVDCYRDALANTKAWRNNPKKGRRPRVRSYLCFCTKARDTGLKKAT
jgi:hypothetical protein